MIGIQENTWKLMAGEASFQDIPTPTLEKWVEDYPYFGVAQFFLAARLQQEGKRDLSKTNYFFTKPLWLQWHLGAAADIRAENTATPSPAEIDPEQEMEESHPAPVAMENKIAGMLSEQFAEFKKPLHPDTQLEFDSLEEKLHTIDYFASQGIKVDLSAMPQDKLTNHLLKFTDWLKQMKHMDSSGSEHLDSNPDRENAVVENARHSNKPREVLTEAMAEVLEKQGQVDKAIQLYIKLSFLNPEKSSYFAAKIEQLKGI